MRSAQHESWEQLELLGVPVAGQFRVMSSGVALENGEVLFAIDAKGNHHLLVPIRKDAVLNPDLRSAGVHLTSRVLDDAENSVQFIDIACQKRHLREVFVHLVDEMLQEIEASPLQAEASCRRVLSRWRELLDREALGILSREALVGLYGELWHLRKLASRNPASHINWSGPLGAVHDFRSKAAALEVKTSLAREGRRFEIHGVDQLAPPEGASLHFAGMLVEADDPSGETVPGLLEELTALGCDAVELLRKLTAVGYDSRDADHYRQFRFRTREIRVYLVDEQFPRIVRSSFAAGNLPNGTERLRYVVDLSLEPPRPIGPEAVASLYDALAEGSA